MNRFLFVGFYGVFEVPMPVLKGRRVALCAAPTCMLLLLPQVSKGRSSQFTLDHANVFFGLPQPLRRGNPKFSHLGRPTDDGNSAATTRGP